MGDAAISNFDGRLRLNPHQTSQTGHEGRRRDIDELPNNEGNDAQDTPIEKSGSPHMQLKRPTGLRA